MSRASQLIEGRRFWFWAAGLLVAGLALRLWLGFFVFFNQGFAWDMASFGDWLTAIQTSGSRAYFADNSFNYPPAFADVLWVLLQVGGWLQTLPGALGTLGPMALLKLPAIVADIGIAVTLLWAGRKWFSPATALVAAAAYLFVPVTWYDSAIWGQVDSLSALPMLLAVLLVIDRKPEWSALALTVAVLMKPQGALVLLVLLPVLIGQVVHKEVRWRRMLTTIGAGLVSFAVIATPWSLEKYAPEQVANIPVVGDFAGLVGQYVSTLGWFPVVSANAFNVWALAGRNSIASTIQNGYVFWIPDGYRILGIPSALIGNGLFLLLAAAIFWLLIKRHSATQTLTAYALLLVGFYILPTRVHERYLVQAFAVLAIVWAPKIIDRIAVVALALANTINLHAILVADLNVQSIDLVSAESAGAGGQSYHSAFAPIIHATDPSVYGFGWVRMDSSFARAEPVVIAVILLQVAGFAYLAWQYLQLNRSKNAS